MDIWGTLFDSFWSGLFAGGLGILLTAPPGYLVPTFICGFAGFFTRNLLMSLGLNQNWSTAVASCAVVLVGAAIIRRHVVSPVALIAAVLPLGPSMPTFNAILDLMRVSSLKGEALNAASVSLIANTGLAFTQSLAIALGLAVGITIMRLIRREKVWESV
jgi:uncharacterized membrane protein YjjB (DUF3815 family)